MRDAGTARPHKGTSQRHWQQINPGINGRERDEREEECDESGGRGRMVDEDKGGGIVGLKN